MAWYNIKRQKEVNWWLSPIIGVEGNTNSINAMLGNINGINNVDNGDGQNGLDRRKDSRDYFYLFNMASVSLILARRVWRWG